MENSSSENRSKALGSPFARPSRKPWLVRPDDGGLFGRIAKTTTVFFRNNFGERHLTPSDLSIGIFFLAIFAVGMRFAAGGFKFDHQKSVPTVAWLTWLVFSILFLLVTSLHLFAAVRRRTMMHDEFSMSDGRPWSWLIRFAPFARDEWDIELFFEPAICIGIGAVLTYYHDWFGIYLIVAGVCMQRQAAGKYGMRRQIDLEVMDARIEAANQPDFDDMKPTKNPTSIKALGESDRESVR